ncbi:MAG TPA: DUF72 domain-containing protein [Actinomycetota bacterium]|nr:DUF72 domain-containing protein [Actinomycetota bacterium]
MAGNLYVGTSGFAYDEWRGSFYPENLKQRDMLAYYGQRFNSVEINYTFRKQPEEPALSNWRNLVPDDFVFTLKAHQRITHWLRLADADGAVSDFLERAKLLGPKLGVILFQCPPNLPFDRSLIESFLAFLPPGPRYAFEFRHPSWDASKELLAAQHAAWCVAETEDTPWPARLPETPFVYLRLRKTDYSDDELRDRGRTIAETLRSGTDVYCYFKHEEAGAGPRFAERFREVALAGAEV